ncbi:MAG: hypothetical protein PHY85_07350, partial [Bacteroidales bacterium]|nr:hypothetical protein [Bacteroidales bacterium]
MKYKVLILFLSITYLSSCSFNNMYLLPTKIAVGTKMISLKTETDSTLVFFNADTFQPVFLKNGLDTIDFDFTIESLVF